MLQASHIELDTNFIQHLLFILQQFFLVLPQPLFSELFNAFQLVHDLHELAQTFLLVLPALQDCLLLHLNLFPLPGEEAVIGHERSNRDMLCPGKAFIVTLSLLHFLDQNRELLFLLFEQAGSLGEFDLRIIPLHAGNLEQGIQLKFEFLHAVPHPTSLQAYHQMASNDFSVSS